MPVEIKCNDVPMTPFNMGDGFVEYRFNYPPDGPGGMVTWYERVGKVIGMMGIPEQIVSFELPTVNHKRRETALVATDQTLYPKGPRMTLVFTIDAERIA